MGQGKEGEAPWQVIWMGRGDPGAAAGGTCEPPQSQVASHKSQA